MAAVKRQRYDVAINGQGFTLALKPEQPAIKARQNDIFSQRIAQGDRDYNDFISWWYLAQTDWFAGFKDVVQWVDDAHYYYKTNIDSWTEPGAIRLPFAQTLKNTFTENVICGAEGIVNNVDTFLVGTDDDPATNKPSVYKSTDAGATWSSTLLLAANQNYVSQLVFRNNNVWCHSFGTGNTDVVDTWDGTTWADQSATIYNAGGTISFQPKSSRCGVAIGSTYYIFLDDATNKKYAIVKTTKDNPTVVGDYTKVLEITNSTAVPFACAEYLGKLYYLLEFSNYVELRVYNPADASDVSVRKFQGVTITQDYGVGNKMLFVLNGLLYVTIPVKEVWTYNGTTMSRVYRQDGNKNSIGNEAVGYLAIGGVVSDNKAWWGNLMTDAINWHNWIKETGDTTSPQVYPVFSDSSDVIWSTDTNNKHRLFKQSTTVYKGAADKNFVVLNNFDKVSGIDKLAYKITMIFKTLVSGQKIAVEYTTGELTSTTTWTVLGSASFTADGATTTKDLYFGLNVTYKKIWFRLKLEGDTTNTPVLYDFVHAYLPMPDYKLHWEFTVKCQNKMRRKDQSKETKDALWLRNFLQQAWLTKSILNFEDFDAMAVDYVSDNPLTASNTTITVTGNTDSFPELGRLLIDTEEIFYSGKNKTQFLNCVRGRRGSLAASHTQNTQISMSHQVLIRNYHEDVLIANDPLSTEYHVSLALQEV